MPLTDKALNRVHRHLIQKRAIKDVMPGGKADNKSPLDFSKEQLIKGVIVEYEHTNDFLKALEIAMDHLTESDTYYDHLEEMESKFEEKAAAMNYIFTVIAATYYGDKDPYKQDVVKRQEDWTRMEPGKTNLENWKHMDGGKVTDYKKSTQ